MAIEFTRHDSIKSNLRIILEIRGGGLTHDLFTSSGIIYRKNIMKVCIS